MRLWVLWLLAGLFWLIPPAGAEAQGVVHKTDELVVLLRQAVHTQYQIPEHDVMIIWNDDTLESKLAKIGGQTTLQVSQADLNRPIGKNQFMFSALQNGRFKTKLSLKISVDGWVQTVMTKRAMTRGEIFSAEHIAVARRRLSELPKHFINSADMVIGNEAFQNLPANAVLNKQMIKERPVMLKGNQVKVQVISGNLTLIAQGVLLEDGYRGRMVKVRILNFAGQKVVQAQVINADEVKMIVD